MGRQDTGACEIICRIAADALAFLMNGQQVFAKHVMHPETTIKAEYYMHDALAAMSGAIVTGLEDVNRRGVALD